MFKADKEFDKARQEATAELLKLLAQLVLEHPEQRFSQILQNYGFVKPTRPINPASAEEFNVHWQNEFYMEPTALLKRVKDRIDGIKNFKG